jgi:hypothetical protein
MRNDKDDVTVATYQDGYADGIRIGETSGWRKGYEQANKENEKIRGKVLHDCDTCSSLVDSACEKAISDFKANLLSDAAVEAAGDAVGNEITKFLNSSKIYANPRAIGRRVVQANIQKAEEATKPKGDD